MLNEDLKATLYKGGAGITGAVVSYFNVDHIQQIVGLLATCAGFVVSIFMAVNLALDFSRKWRDRNTPTRELQRDEDDDK